jgi:hypothetical protein
MMLREFTKCQSHEANALPFKHLKTERFLQVSGWKGWLTMRETPSSKPIPRQPLLLVPPAIPERDENDVTQPIRIISSRHTRPRAPRPRVSWFKKYEEDGLRRTPNFTEIGDPQA